MSGVLPELAGKKLRIGVDLGGTKIEFVALESDGTELRRFRVPTPRRRLRCHRESRSRWRSASRKGIAARRHRRRRHSGTISASPQRQNANSTWNERQAVRQKT